MTGNNYPLLYTSIIIELFSGNKTVADRINKLNSFYLPAVVVGELYTGVFSSSHESKHLKKLRDFLSLATIIEINDETAEHYGKIASDLRKKGRPIPTNDIWIAAIAKQYELPLITKDKHFKEIKSIQTREW